MKNWMNTLKIQDCFKIKEKNAGSNQIWFIQDLSSFTSQLNNIKTKNYLKFTVDEAGVAELGLRRPTYDRVSRHNERGFEISNDGSPSASVKKIWGLANG